MVKPGSKRPSFFKVMIGDFTSTLRIPPLFSKQYLQGNEGVKSVLIRDTGGRKWHVKVCRSADDRCSLRNGWEGFVRDLSIVHGDFLVFYYDGGFVFDVQVYGNSGCEKDCIATGAGAAAAYKDVAALVKNKKKSLKGRRHGKPLYIGRTSRGLIVSRRSRKFAMTSAYQEACNFKPRNPHFVRASTASNNAYLTIPVALVKEFGLGKKKFITLQDSNLRAFKAKLHGSKDSRVRLYGGWLDFQKMNSLGEGDACCFEFMQGGDLIHVHMFYEKTVKEESADSLSKDDDLIQPVERPSSKRERDRALCAAQSFKSERLFFVHSCRISRLYYVTIPFNLVGILGLREKKSFTLFNPYGRQWSVEIRNGKNRGATFGAGWCNFFRGNNLKPGDACVFEFLNFDSVQVHIFRVEKPEATPAAIAAATASAIKRKAEAFVMP